MLSSILGFAGSKAAVLLAAGALSASAVGAAAATGNLPGTANEHALQAVATATATATATETANAAVVITDAPESPGAQGLCNAIAQGSETGQEKKAEAK